MVFDGSDGKIGALVCLRCVQCLARRRSGASGSGRIYIKTVADMFGKIV